MSNGDIEGTALEPVLTLQELDGFRLAIVTLEGKLVARDLTRKVYRQFAEFSRSNDASRILIDVRAASLQLGILDLYNMPKQALAEGLDRRSRIAVLSTPDQSDKLTFLETVSQNLGLSVYTFVDRQTALRVLAR